MDPWVSFLQSFSLKSVYFKDLTAADLSTMNWEVLASLDDPLLMHLKKSDLNNALEGLVGGGMSPKTPCAALAEVTQKDSLVSGELGNIALKSSKLTGDSLYVLIATELPAPISAKPKLAGKRVLITRARSQAMDLTQLLRKEGATIYEIPTIQIILNEKKCRELGSALDSINEYSWLLLTSVNSVNILNDLMRSRRQDWSVFRHLKIACIGKSTARRVEEFGGSVHLVPDQFQAEGLLDRLLPNLVRGQKILLPRAENSRELLPKTLQKAGAEVREINIYRAELPKNSKTELIDLLRSTQLDFITFTSSSTVRNFMEMAGDLLAQTSSHAKIASIGPITASTLEEYGIHPDVIAEEFTMEGLVQAMIDASAH